MPFYILYHFFTSLTHWSFHAGACLQLMPKLTPSNEGGSVWDLRKDEKGGFVSGNGIYVCLVVSTISSLLEKNTSLGMSLPFCGTKESLWNHQTLSISCILVLPVVYNVYISTGWWTFSRLFDGSISIPVWPYFHLFFRLINPGGLRIRGTPQRSTA